MRVLCLGCKGAAPHFCEGWRKIETERATLALRCQCASCTAPTTPVRRVEIPELPSLRERLADWFRSITRAADAQTRPVSAPVAGRGGSES